MLFRLPQPLHGWREFVHEVVIVVIGVLLALAGAELADTLHWRAEARDFSKEVDHELGLNLGTYHAIILQRPCVTRRLAELERFLAASTAGHQLKLQRPIGWPRRYSQYTSVWNNRGAEVTAHLPGDRRRQYAELYDEFANKDALGVSERDVWRGLDDYDQPEPLDHADRMRLRGLLTRAEGVNVVAIANYNFMLKLTRPLGIQPIGEDEFVKLPSDDDFCRPLLAK
jgi:hypothetical protein